MLQNYDQVDRQSDAKDLACVDAEFDSQLKLAMRTEKAFLHFGEHKISHLPLVLLAHPPRTIIV